MNTNEMKIPTPEEQEKTLKHIEMLKAFDFDRKWLENSVNEARYLIKGKGIAVLESGEIRWFEIYDERYDLFGFKTVIDDKELYSTEYLSENENSLIRSIIQNDTLLKKYNLNLLSISQDDEYWYIIDPKSRAIFKVAIADLEYIDDGIDKKLCNFNENDFTTAYEIKFDNEATLYVNTGGYMVQDGRTDCFMCEQINQEDLENILSGKCSPNLDEIITED